MSLTDDEKKILLASLGIDELPSQYFLGICPFKSSALGVPISGLIKAKPGQANSDLQGVQSVPLPMPCLGCYCPLWIDNKDISIGLGTGSIKGFCAFKVVALSLVENLKL